MIDEFEHNRKLRNLEGTSQLAVFYGIGVDNLVIIVANQLRNQLLEKPEPIDKQENKGQGKVITVSRGKRGRKGVHGINASIRGSSFF